MLFAPLDLDNKIISLADYMSICLAHYYGSRNPIGEKFLGDFITSPSISQMFGEILAVAIMDQCLSLMRKEKFYLVELGPGSGQLMLDMWRTFTSTSIFPLLREQCLGVHLVETSHFLRRVQQDTLKTTSIPRLTWHQSVHTLPNHAPCLIVANEFFDALPYEHYIFDAQKKGFYQRGVHRQQWCCYKVCTTEENNWLYKRMQDTRMPHDGDIIEVSPIALSIMDHISQLIHQQGGCCYIIDYGYTQNMYGSTLQALKNHAYQDPLNNPGEQDLTCHVSFDDLQQVAHRYPSLMVGDIINQHTFLKRNGIDIRYSLLQSKKNSVNKNVLARQYDRLVNINEMGKLFKILTLFNLK